MKNQNKNVNGHPIVPSGTTMYEQFFSRLKYTSDYEKRVQG